MSTTSILQLENISKAFPGVQALDQATLMVEAGEIHGLVGENGAGKSTIIKVLAGVYTPDDGSITISGQAIEAGNVKQVHAAGVRFIHQELHLVPHFTITESVFMGQELQGVAGIRTREMRQRAEAFLAEYLHYPMKGNQLIRNLGVAERKLVQIARALIDEQARVVVFDEPTGPLASEEVAQLFAAIRQLKARGIAIIYVSHYLGEITELCDRVTVFRAGKTVSVLKEQDADNAETIIKHMVGRGIDTLYPERQQASETVRLAVKNLTLRRSFDRVSFDLKQGEIIGIAGLVGSGREALIDVLYGLRTAQAGSMTLAGKPLHINKPNDAVTNGIVLVPRDRRNTGLVLDMTMADNINLASLDEVSVAKLEQKRRSHQRAVQLADDLDIRPRNPAAITRFLSGGNQQKVVLARWLATGSTIFILDEPTIGVDIGAKVEIYQLIADLAQEGASVIISSSDPAELLGLSHRVLVLLRGEVVADEPAVDLSLDRLLALTTGGVAARSTV